MRLMLLAALCVMAVGQSKDAIIADLRTQLAASEAANRDLRKRLSDAKASATGAASAISAGVKAQAKTHSEEKQAVSQAQSESTQTLVNTDASVRAQTEFEKQLGRVEGNVSKLLIAVILLTIVVVGFTGVIAYLPRRITAAMSNARKADDARPTR